MTTPALDHAAAFLAAVCADPASDEVRLMYADFLEERGDPLGEFIRVQCELASDADRERVCRETCEPPDFEGCPQKELRRREWELLKAYGDGWAAPCLPWWSAAVHLHRHEFAFRRGFVEGITLGVDDFLRHAGALARAAPLTRVTLAGAVPWSARSSERECSWFRWVDAAEQPPEPTDRVPLVLFRRLRGKIWGLKGCARRYPSPEVALADLSAACVGHARAAAGLPALE